MLTIEKADGGVLHVHADGQLTTDDYVEFVTRFEWFADGHSSPILMLIELGSDFGGWDLDALFRDQNFDLTPNRRIRRIAIVADERWEHWGAGALYASLAGEIRFFEREELVKAGNWLRQSLSGAAA